MQIITTFGLSPRVRRNRAQALLHAQQNQPGWLDKKTLATLTWAFSTRYYHPNQVVHGCVPNFGRRQIVMIFQMDLANQPKSVYVKEPAGKSCTGWTAAECLFSAAEVGVPSERRRGYLSLAMDSGQQRPRAGAGCTFHGIMSAPLQCDAGIFCLEQGIGDIQDKRPIANRKELDIEVHLRDAMRRGLVDQQGRWAVPCAVVDIDPAAAFSAGSWISKFPTIARRSVMFDLVAQQPMPLSAYWLATGVAVPVRQQQRPCSDVI